SQSAGPTAAGTTSAGPTTGATTGTEISTKTVIFRYDGRRPPSDLDEAMIALPDFEQPGCPTGPTHFHSGEWTATSTDPGPLPRAAMAGVAVADVPGDGKSEHVALVHCTGGGDPGTFAAQVVALGPPAGPNYPALAKVVGIHGGTGSLLQPQVGRDGA